MYESIKSELGQKVEEYKRLLKKYKDRRHKELRTLELDITGRLFLKMAELIVEAHKIIQQAIAINNTALATGICISILEKGPEAFEELQNFSDTATRQIRETETEVNETIEQLQSYGEAAHIEDIDVDEE